VGPHVNPAADPKCTRMKCRHKHTTSESRRFYIAPWYQGTRCVLGDKAFRTCCHLTAYSHNEVRYSIVARMPTALTCLDSCYRILDQLLCRRTAEINKHGGTRIPSGRSGFHSRLIRLVYGAGFGGTSTPFFLSLHHY
jgi:hypothetical protein